MIRGNNARRTEKERLALLPRFREDENSSVTSTLSKHIVLILYSHRDNTIEMGIPLLGFRASSPVVAITSKPTKA